VRHLEDVQEDVDLVATVSRVIQQTTGAMGGVEDSLGEIPLAFEEISQGARRALVGHEIEIFKVSSEEVPSLLRGPAPDCDTTDQPQRDVTLLGNFDEPQSFGRER
jgi:hypothetical protein